MNFWLKDIVKYSMSKLMKLRKFAFALVCVAFLVAFACMYFKKEDAKAVQESAVLTVWQIDSFEGGKGSRADFLKNVGNSFNKSENCYVNVISLSSDAARLNLSKGSAPDVISYGAGTYGLEGYIKDYNVWCRGMYCLLTLDSGCDFSDVTAQNTVLNNGKDNFAGAAALLCGLSGSKTESATSAYVKLLNGEYKYLLGTQRDIFRLKTRNVSFAIKPITEFNDLYQSISITRSCGNAGYAQKYINFLLSQKSEIVKIGLFSDGAKLYEDEMSQCENLNFNKKITYPISLAVKTDIEKAVSAGDINMLKELLK